MKIIDLLYTNVVQFTVVVGDFLIFSKYCPILLAALKGQVEEAYPIVIGLSECFILISVRCNLISAY
jgi:hypothetical protein